MIQVNVWDSAWTSYLPGGQEGSPGHASIMVGGVYVSFWPGKEAGTLKWNGFNTRTFSEDIAYYKKNNQSLWSQELPNDNVGKGLNESKMQQRWEQIKKSGVNYSWDFQCSAVVNELLIAGGCQKFVKPFSTWSSWYVGAVSPSDIQDFTVTLAQKIKEANS